MRESLKGRLKLNMIRLLLFCSLAFFFLSFFRVTMNFSNNGKKKKDLFYKHNPLLRPFLFFFPFFFSLSESSQAHRHVCVCVCVYIIYVLMRTWGAPGVSSSSNASVLFPFFFFIKPVKCPELSLSCSSFFHCFFFFNFFLLFFWCCLTGSSLDFLLFFFVLKESEWQQRSARMRTW